MTDSGTIGRLTGELAEKQAVVDALMRGYLNVAMPVVDGLSFDVVYQPATLIEQLGGDWYDVFQLPDGRVAFSLGDVCGRGLQSAVKMGQAKHAIKVAAALPGSDPHPVAVLSKANKIIFLNDHVVEFTTAIYGVIDVASRKVTYASAGHHPPILGRPGKRSEVMPNHGFALGVEFDMPDLIQEHAFFYEPSTLFVLYTDGLIEFSHNADEGERRLLQATADAANAHPARPAQFIVESVLRGDVRHPDDVAVLTIFFE